jgi:hypothetical protein
MSADNAIVVLETTDRYQIVESRVIQFSSSIPAWRVAETTNVDDFTYLEHRGLLLDLGVRLNRTFGKSKVYYTEAEAMKAAYALEEEMRQNCQVLEYGIVEVDLSKHSFPL